jgi:sulfane dehydrogenase subunit SoxC
VSNTKRRRRVSPLDPIAGNGLINRRALLGQGLAIAGTMGAGAALTGAAAEPLTDQPWSLEFGSVMPAV